MNFYQEMAGQWDAVEASGEAQLRFPKGVVTVAITGSEVKPSAGKSEETHLVQHLELTVLEGEYKGATTKVYYSLRNPNQRAVDIGKSQLKALFLAIGIYPKSGVIEVHNRPFKVRADHAFNSYADRTTGELRPSVNVNIKGFYSVLTEVRGEDEPLVSQQQTLNSPEGVAFIASLTGNIPSPVSAIPAARPTAPNVAPKTAPVKPPRPPVSNTSEAIDAHDEDAPAWLNAA
jgi:hypothetical protein